MDCPKCGEATQPDAVFCGNCGQHLTVQPPGLPPTPNPTATPLIRKAENRANAGLVFGLLGVPGSLIPILGLSLGLVGLILGTTSRKHYRKFGGVLAIIFSCIAVTVSLAFMAYSAQHNPSLMS